MTTSSSTLCATSASRWLDTSTARPRPAWARRSSRIQRMPGRIEAVGGLVEDQHLRVSEQRGRDGQPLAHAHRVPLHAPVGRAAGEVHLLRAPHRPAPAGDRPRRPAHAGGCGRCGRDGSSPPPAPRPPARSDARAPRSCGRRSWPRRRPRARGPGASEASCSCRRRWARGSRSPGPPAPGTTTRTPPAPIRSAWSGPRSGSPPRRPYAANRVRSGSRSPRSRRGSTVTQPIPRDSARARACGLICCAARIPRQPESPGSVQMRSR